VRVVFINRFYYPDESATSRMLADLCVRLVRRGVEVQVIAGSALQRGAGDAGSMSEALRTVQVHRVRCTNLGTRSLFGRALDYTSFLFGASWRLLRNRQADVVVIMTDPPLGALLLAPIARLRGMRVIHWLQDIYPEIATALLPGMPVRIAGRLLMPWRDRCLQRAVANVAVGRCMATMLERRGIHSRLITNWFPGDDLQPVAHADNPLRAAWGLRDHFVVAYSGNFGRAHEFDTLLRAAELLRDESRVVFLCIGQGAQLAALRCAVSARGLHNHVFQAFQPAGQLRYSLSAADLHLVTLNSSSAGLIVPSKWYGVAGVGRPCVFIGPGESEIARVVVEHECGWQIATGEAQALAARLRWCLENRSECARLGGNARLVYDRHYNGDQAAAAWGRLLHSFG
jgi:glycosyltransferase involved in cell wall biosynthesis